MLNESVRNYLAEHRRQQLAKLMEFLRIPSVANVKGPRDGCAEAARWLADHLRSIGLEARIDPIAIAGAAHKPNVVAFSPPCPGLPTLLIYGHYDVQPPDPLDLWTSPPFEPAVRDEKLFARGADDDKGQLFCHLMALEAWQKAGGGLPVNVKLLIDGEEEIGSPGLEPYMVANRDLFAADAAVISDSEFFEKDMPSITYALRGVAYAEIVFTGPAADIHSGIHGGAVTNPINALAKLVAALHDETGRVTLPGFYDGVEDVTGEERRQWAALNLDQAAYAKSLGVDALGGGEKHYSLLERRWSRPTLDCNGIVGGYTGEGRKTIIPARAEVKIAMRLVPGQDRRAIEQGVRQFVNEHTPPGITAQVTVHATARPVLLNYQAPAFDAARAALKEAFGREPAMIRCGASVPVTELIQRILGLDTVMMGLGLPDDNLHSPNEKFDLAQLWNGSLAAAAFLQNLAK